MWREIPNLFKGQTGPIEIVWGVKETNINLRGYLDTE